MHIVLNASILQVVHTDKYGMQNKQKGVNTLKRSDYVKHMFDNNADLECIKVEGDYALLFIFRDYAYLTDMNKNDVLESIIKGDDFIEQGFKEFFDLEAFLDEALYNEEKGENYVVDFDQFCYRLFRKRLRCLQTRI